MRGGWATLGVTIIAAVVPFVKLANTRSVDHLEGKFLIILKVVEDHGVGLLREFAFVRLVQRTKALVRALVLED